MHSGDVVINATVPDPRRRPSILLLTNRSPPVAIYNRVPPTPEDVNNEMSVASPVEEVHPDSNDQRSWDQRVRGQREAGVGSERSA